MAELVEGQKAPGFELPRDGGGVLRLADLAGKPVVLYFYPQDDTETCTAEAIDFSAHKAEFAKLGAAVIGISPDSVKRHDKFKKKYSLALDLAADEELKTLNAYGVWGEKTMFGRKYMGVDPHHFPDRRRRPHRADLEKSAGGRPRRRSSQGSASPVTRNKSRPAPLSRHVNATWRQPCFEVPYCGCSAYRSRSSSCFGYSCADCCLATLPEAPATRTTLTLIANAVHSLENLC